jgi:glycine/D-amino acid oxidase-like deaminating enzyme
MPIITSVQSSSDFPKHADAVIIGAGIIGIATALELQAFGLDVVVVEKGEVAAEQSSRNWGWCRQMGRDPREIPLIKVSLDLWRGMNTRIGAETGYRTAGIAYLSETQTDLAGHQAWCDANVKQNGLSTRMISSGEAAALAPGSAQSWMGGMYTDDDGRAEPFIAVPAMAEFYKARGGKIFTQCAARGVERSAGRVSEVVTEKGTIKTDSVIVAGGYWSERFLANLNLRFPQSGVISSVMRTSPIDLGHERTFCGNRFAIRKRLDGGYTIAHNLYSVADLTPNHIRYAKEFLPILIKDRAEVKLRIGRRFIDEWSLARRWALDEVSPFERVRILDPQPYQSLLDDAASALKKIYPAFAHMKIEETWAGMIDATPDAVPVIDKIDAIPGLFLASGFSGHGFGLGPGAGKLMAEIVTGHKPCVDPTPFRFARFGDGTKIRPVTGL